MFYEAITPMEQTDPCRRVVEIGCRPVAGWPSFEAHVQTPFDVWPELAPEPEVNRAEGWEPEYRPATVTLEFVLDGGEGEAELNDSIRGRYYRGALMGLDSWLRMKLKYGDDSLPAEVLVTLQRVRDRLLMLTEGQGLPLFD